MYLLLFLMFISLLRSFLVEGVMGWNMKSKSILLLHWKIEIEIDFIITFIIKYSHTWLFLFDIFVMFICILKSHEKLLFCFQSILWYVYCPNFRHNELTFHTDISYFKLELSKIFKLDTYFFKLWTIRIDRIFNKFESFVWILNYNDK